MRAPGEGTEVHFEVQILIWGQRAWTNAGYTGGTTEPEARDALRMARGRRGVRDARLVRYTTKTTAEVVP